LQQRRQQQQQQRPQFTTLSQAAGNIKQLMTDRASPACVIAQPTYILPHAETSDAAGETI